MFLLFKAASQMSLYPAANVYFASACFLKKEISESLDHGPVISLMSNLRSSLSYLSTLFGDIEICYSKYKLFSL